MVPDIDLQLQVVLKALTDNVKPAVDPADKVAVEQLNLVLATLGMVRERLPVYRTFVRRILEDEIALAERVADAADQSASMAATLDAARAALADPEMEAGALELVRTNLTEKTVSLMSSFSGRASIDALMPVILAGAKPQLERFRAWCVTSGFEPNVNEFRPISELL